MSAKYEGEKNSSLQAVHSINQSEMFLGQSDIITRSIRHVCHWRCEKNKLGSLPLEQIIQIEHNIAKKAQNVYWIRNDDEEVR